MFEDIVPDSEYGSFQLYTNNVIYMGFTDYIVMYTIVPWVAVCKVSNISKNAASLPSKRQYALYKLKHHTDKQTTYQNAHDFINHMLKNLTVKERCEFIDNLSYIYLGGDLVMDYHDDV